MKQKNTDTKKRKSGFNPNRTCYLTADGKYYCYERWDVDAKCMVTQKLEVGKDLSIELTIMLDESDHGMDLNDRYQEELKDPLFKAKVNSYKADPDNDEAIDPLEQIPSKNGSPEDEIFSEPKPENPDAEKVREVIDNKCNARQQNVYFSHFGELKQLEQIRKEEADKEGKEKSLQSIVNVKNDVIKKAADALGVTPVKRRKSKKS